MCGPTLLLESTNLVTTAVTTVQIAASQKAAHYRSMAMDLPSANVANAALADSIDFASSSCASRKSAIDS